MKKMFLIVPVLSALALAGAVAAEQAAAPAAGGKEKAAEKLGVLTGRLLVKLQDLQKLLDGNANGAQAGFSNIQYLYGKVSQNIQKQMNEENAKPQEMRNGVLVDSLNKKSQKLQEMYNECHQKQWPEYGRKMAEPSAVFYSLNEAYRRVVDMQQYWSRADLDMEVLIAVLSALDRKADEVRAQAQAALDAWVKFVAEWEAFAKE